MGQDLGAVAAGFVDNFAYGRLVLARNTYVQLVDDADNAAGEGDEALYLNELIVASGTTLDLNGHNVYVRAAQLDGTVLGGSVQLLSDGGRIPLNLTVAGNIDTVAETDEWTFFARAGQGVTIFVDTGIGSQPEPLQPRLGYAEVRLFDADDHLLATGSNSIAGEAASLLGVELPADGTYRLEVSAPTTQPGSTGNYLLSVWDATMDVGPMSFGERYFGQIETAYSVDRWTFSAQENQQVQFDLINASNPYIRFQLSGPDGWMGFDGLGEDSSLITLPHSGSYVLEAYSTGNLGGSYAFCLEETSLTELTLDTAHLGTFVGSGQAQLFHVTLPEQDNLVVFLDDTSDANRNELYAKLGAPPTRSDYGYRFDAMASADQEILVPVVPPGDWYILVYSEATPEPGDYLLVVTGEDIFIDSISPDYHGDREDAVITLTGLGFGASTTVELVAGDGTAYAGTPGDIATSTRLTATFAAGSVPPGVYSVRTTKPDGTLLRFRPDGRLDYTEDANGNRIAVGYTEDVITSLTHSSGQSLQIDYNMDGMIEAITDSDGRATRFGYDGDYLTTVVAPDGKTTQYVYDTDGPAATRHALLEIHEPGRDEFYQYDAFGRVTATSRGPQGTDMPVTFSYDTTGTVSETDALGGTTDYYYDYRGTLAAQRDALSNTTFYSHDADGRLTSLTDPLGQISTYRYDARGNQIETTEPMGNTTVYSYSGSTDRLLAVTDANGNAMEYTYDTAGNRISTTYADGSVERMAYDPLGNLTERTNRRRDPIAYTSDDFGRIVRKDYSDGTWAEFDYDDGNGNLSEVRDVYGTTMLEYNSPVADDLLTKITYPTGRFVEYEYDSTGRRAQLLDQDGYQVNYSYDALGRLDRLADAEDATLASYGYDALGRLSRKTLGNSTYSTYSYDAADRLQHLVNHAPDGSVNSRFDYTFDKLGRRTGMGTLDGLWTYDYDAIGQLTHAGNRSRPGEQ